MIDGGLIVGYLTAALLRGGQRWADRTIDSLLDRLTTAVTRRLGKGPVERLAQDPHDATAQREVSLTIEGAIAANQALARELAQVVAELDKKGGRQILNQVYAQMNVQAFDRGIAVGRDFNYFNAPDPGDLSGAPFWVKTFIVLGAAICAVGFVLFAYGIFTGFDRSVASGSGGFPPKALLGFGVTFVGIVIAGIGSLGRALSRRR